jgi:Na+/melibiose symporter-like transporter
MFAAGNKVCASIYRPVWIEQFGLSKYKSVFFSLVQIMSSYGQIIGFSLGSLLFKSNWKMGLLSILGMMYIIAIGFLVVPGKYFFRSYMYYEDKLVDIEDSNEDYATRSSTPSIAGDTESARSSTEGKKRYGTVFVNAKNVEKQKREKSGEKKTKKTLCEKFKNLLSDLFFLVKNKIFLLCMIKRANTTFILQIVHSYLKQYQQHSLEDVNEDLIVLFYSISSLGSTAVGGLLGGIITKKLGGYESKKSTYIVIIPEILTTATISFLAFTKTFYIYNINLILFFCFISIGSPVIQGYLIKTIPKSIKGIGVGLDMIVSTFLGKIPGPVIYGALEDKYLNENRALAWQICMCYFYVGVIIVFILCYFKYKEEAIKDSVEVKIEDNIVNLAAISSGTDANDFFSMKIPVPKRSKSMKYNFRIQSEDKDTEKNSILSSILEGSEKEENDDKDEKTEKAFSIEMAEIKLDNNDDSVA